MDAGTKLVGLFGHPVGHTLSPLFMNEALKALGLNCVYMAFDVDEGEIGRAVGAVRAMKWIGANVTIPHKRAVAAGTLLDSIHEDARAIGAVNCIVNRDGTLHGHNTDHLGFLEPLAARGFQLDGTSAVLFGCGGAARGVLYALARGGVKRVYLINRTQSRAMEFITWSRESLKYDSIFHAGATVPLRKGASIQDAVAEARLFVNTTPVGMYPDTGVSPLGGGLTFPSGALVYDLIYNPWKTALLQKAEREGAQTLNGLPMLILQGIHSLALWFPERAGEVFPLQERLLAMAAAALGHPAGK